MRFFAEKFFRKKSQGRGTPIQNEFAAGPLAEEVTQALDLPEEVLFSPETEHTEQGLSLPFAEAAGYMAIGTRAVQQDAIRMGEANGDMVGILSDGMGGLRGGEKASNLSAQFMLDSLQSEKVERYPAALEKILFRANEQVKNIRDEQERKIEAGATLIAAVLNGENLYWCSVGDSHIYLYSDHHLNQLNTDHNLGTRLDEMVRAGAMTAEAASAYPNRAALTSYLGIAEMTLIEQNSLPLQLQKNDIILLCSDGLYRCLSEESICQILSLEQNISAAARSLVNSALLVQGEHDNTSALLIRYTGGSAVGSRGL